MKTSATVEKIAPVLVKALGEIKAIHRDGKNPFLKNKYATLDNILEGTRPVLLKHSLCVLQPVSECGVETIIMHTSGEWVSSDCANIPTEQSKGLSMAQARGVSITYMKRYQLGSLLGISTDEDTDGQYGDNTSLEPKGVEQPKINAKEPAKVNGKKVISENLLIKGISRISSGEFQVYEKLKDTFTLTPEQSKRVEKAKDNYVQSLEPAL
jgi:hypothetical protein